MEDMSEEDIKVCWGAGRNFLLQTRASPREMRLTGGLGADFLAGAPAGWCSGGGSDDGGGGAQQVTAACSCRPLCCNKAAGLLVLVLLLHARGSWRHREAAAAKSIAQAVSRQSWMGNWCADRDEQLDCVRRAGSSSWHELLLLLCQLWLWPLSPHSSVHRSSRNPDWISTRLAELDALQLGNSPRSRAHPHHRS